MVATSREPASHRAPRKSVPVSRTAVSVTLATAAAGSVALLPGLASADPGNDVNAIKAKVDDLHQQAEQATEAYNEANTRLSDLQRKVDQIQGRITTEQATLDGARSSLGGLAAAQYETGGIDSMLQLMLNNSPDSYLQQASTQAHLNSNQTAVLRNAQEIQRQLAQDKATATDDLAQLQKTRDLMAQRKADIEAKEQQARDLLNRLTAPQRAQYRRLLAQSGVSASTIANLPVPSDPRAAIAVAFAKAQLGKPYVWGAAGPSAYDCSGLTMAAWGKAGVSMPHGSRDQYYMFKKVSKSQLQPGDLVLFYSDMHHIGIYVGNNTVIHAANPSSPIEYAPIDLMPNAGYVRP